jgi:TPR repeat protein
MSWLGYLYEKGYGVEKNEKEAIMWYKKSGDNFAKNRLKVLDK